MTWEPLQAFINRGSHPRQKKKETSLRYKIFFKKNFSNKEVLSKAIKPPLSTVEVYKEWSSVGSSLNTL